MSDNIAGPVRFPGTPGYDTQLASVQKAYENRRARLQGSIADLDEAHAEWLAMNDVQKYMRLAMVAAFKKQGAKVDVYSKELIAAVNEAAAKLHKEADEAMERLAGRHF